MEPRTSQLMWRRERCFVLPVGGWTNGIVPSYRAYLGHQAKEASS